MAVRGHQLGYRPKTNSYDAWDVRRWEQYIRELAIFGVNTIELIPPRSDDAADSPHFPLPQMEMMVEMSRIADEYGLDVSIWYPAHGSRITRTPRRWSSRSRNGAKCSAACRASTRCSCLAAIPATPQPKYLMALLEKQTANLHRYHPKAQMWMSPQSFTKAWMDEFFGIMKTEPAWLERRGVRAAGPHVQPAGTAPADSAALPHPLLPGYHAQPHSQYPVPDWDVAFALTEGREGINPRPLGEATIFRSGEPYTIGFLTYSEGCNDDVNKFVWSGLGWNPRAPASRDILRDYAAISSAIGCAERFAAGPAGAGAELAAGRWLPNTASIPRCAQFQELERTATPQHARQLALSAGALPRLLRRATCATG